MNSLSFLECCQLFAIDPKTLRQWLAQAHMSLQTHPKDGRIKCLSREQVQTLARLHGLALSLPSEMSEVPARREQTIPVPEPDWQARLAQLEAQVATLQTQLTDLTLQLLREREQRLLALEAQLTTTGDHTLASLSGGALSVPGQSEMPAFACHPTEKRAPLIPLIEYGARGRYVLICPNEGELHITPNSPEWFAWLASLSSFRFVGLSGRFSARRGYNHRPTRGWYAQRGIHQKNYSKYIGVSENITTDRLEQIAAHFQSYMQ